ncbi:MAG: Nucleotidyltransferase domain protein [Candidatus Izimaplasma bacterium HR2]|nr:MAG: Nucleotidyltransferase domain protein [Candidatus Izimaplasma bacterium HR2]
MNKELHQVVNKFKEDISSLLEQEVIDVIIYGSAVRGGFNPFDSDIDFIVFVDRKLSSKDISKLLKYHLMLRGKLTLDKLLEGRYMAIEDGNVINGYYVGTNSKGWKEITSLGFGHIESAMILDSYTSLNNHNIINEIITYNWDSVIKEIYIQINGFLNNRMLGVNDNYTKYAIVTAARSYYTFTKKLFISKQGALNWMKEIQSMNGLDNPREYILRIKYKMLPIHHCLSKRDIVDMFNFMSANLDFVIKNDLYVKLRRKELNSQFLKDKELLLYIKDNDEIICALSMKHKDDKEITLSMLATNKKDQKYGLAKRILIEAERLCVNKGYKRISLGARASSANFYVKMNYKPMLMVQVFGKINIDDILRVNKEQKNYEVINIIDNIHNKSVFLEIETVDEMDIKIFQDNLKHPDVQYVFTKEL